MPALLILSPACPGEVQPGPWTRTYPNVPAASLNGIAWTGDHFVAVGSPDALFTSVGGESWISREDSLVSGSYFQDVCAFGDLIYACNAEGRVGVSIDGGLRWSLQDTGSEWPLQAIATNGFFVVAVGWRGTIVRSSHADPAWEAVESGVSSDLKDVIRTASGFVAVGDDDITISADEGLTWTPVSLPADLLSAAPRSLTMTDSGTLVMGNSNGTIHLSSDGGHTWRRNAHDRPLSGTGIRVIRACKEQWVAILENGWVYRSEGVDQPWSLADQTPATFNDAVVDNARVWMVGAGLSIASLDLETGRARPHSPGFSQSLNSLAIGSSGIWAAGSNGQILRSIDQGASWEATSWNPSTLTNLGTVQGGVVATSNGGIHLSEDSGESWTFLPVASGFINDFVEMDTRWFAAGRGAVFRSDDRGRTWTERSIPGVTSGISHVASDGSILVASGSGGLIATSDDDGETWTTRNSGTSVWLGRAEKAGPHWFVVGEDDTILRSGSDGTSWQRVATPVPDYVDILDITWTGEFLIALTSETYAFSNFERVALVSGNFGESWQAYSTGQTERLFAIASDGTSTIAVGSDGVISRVSADGRLWEAVSGGSDTAVTGITPTPFGFFAIGRDGLLLRARDHGRSWIKHPLPTYVDLKAIEWTGSALLVFGQLGNCFRSVDGIGWDPVPGMDFGYSGMDLAASEQHVILRVGSALHESADDGITWKKVTTTGLPSKVSKVFWAGHRFLGLDSSSSATQSSIYASADRRNWSLLAVTEPLTSISGDDSGLIASTEDSGFIRSRDGGATWNPEPRITPLGGIRNLAWQDDRLAAVDRLGQVHIWGPPAGIDYLSWMRSLGWSGQEFLPEERSPGGRPYVEVYAFDRDGDGRLSAAERRMLPHVDTGAPGIEAALELSLPMPPRRDLHLSFESSGSIGVSGWSVSATRSVNGTWSGPAPPEVRSTGQAEEIRFPLPPDVATGFYRMSLRVR